MIWTDERVELLKACWDKGLSASATAARLGGITRNAVIGKISRLGLCGRRVESKGQKKPRNTGVRLRQKLTRMMMEDVVSIPIPKPAIFTEEHKCTLFGLSESSCRYPLWEDDVPFDEKFYCGTPEADVAGGRPYCAFHSDIAFNGFKKSDADKEAATA